MREPNMPQDHHTHVCVGGPLAGQRFQSFSENGFVVPKLDQSVFRADIGPAGGRSPPVTYFRYRDETFNTPEGPMIVWAPEGQTIRETMQELLTTYQNYFQTVQHRAETPTVGMIPDRLAALRQVIIANTSGDE